MMAEINNEMPWYVLKTKPKKEKIVFASLSGQKLDLFLPQIKGITTTKPLFPSYLFVRADLDEACHRLIRYTRGISYILGDERGPQPIATDIVMTLLAQTKDGQIIEPHCLLKEGDRVRVRTGVLKDLVGIVERKLSDERRVEVLFKWWHANLKARLRYEALERAA